PVGGRSNSVSFSVGAPGLQSSGRYKPWYARRTTVDTDWLCHQVFDSALSVTVGHSGALLPLPPSLSRSILLASRFKDCSRPWRRHSTTVHRSRRLHHWRGRRESGWKCCNLSQQP